MLSDGETKLNFPVIIIYKCLAGILRGLVQASVGQVAVGPLC